MLQGVEARLWMPIDVVLGEQLIHLLCRDAVDLVDSHAATIILFRGEIFLKGLGQSLVDRSCYAKGVGSGKDLGGIVGRRSHEEKFTISLMAVLRPDGG